MLKSEIFSRQILSWNFKMEFCLNSGLVWKRQWELLLPNQGTVIQVFYFLNLKLVSIIFYQFFIFSPNDSHSKTEKCFLFHVKSSFCSQDFQIFVFFLLPFHFFQIQKDKWKWNNQWCHALFCINLKVWFLE